MAAVVGLAAASPALALDVTDYSATQNDRFTSGFPASPVANSAPGFVGAGYDLSGVGWAAANPTKGFGFVTPQHYLVARHYGGASAITVRGADGTLHTASQESVTNTGYGVVFQGQSTGDLSIGQLSTSMPANWQVARYAVLDLNASSSANSSYNNRPLLVSGRGNDGSSSPRIGEAVVATTAVSGAYSYLTSSRSGETSVQLQVGDSGSPVFIPWVNPAGNQQLMIVGNNAAVTATDNFYNAIGSSNVINAVNAITAADGYALRVQGNTNAVWTGAGNGSISQAGNWSGGSRNDQYVGFAAGGAAAAVNVDAATNLRGVSFTAAAGATQGFTFSGAGTLTIGRGGITNYTGLRQTFNAAITLGSHQYWDVGTGGVTAGAINTNGKLLEIAGAGTARITGPVSGAGGIALSGSRLELTGASTYTGHTWVHSGKLVVNGAIGASSGVTVAAGAELAGSGVTAAVSGAGLVSPGNGAGILTAPSVDASGGLGFAFDVTQRGAPAWGNAAASGNDVLRLTGATPLASPLSAANVINVFFDVSSLEAGGTFLGGFFTDASTDFLSSVENATFAYYALGDGLGTDAIHNGLGYYVLDTDFLAEFEGVDVSTVDVAMADFADGTVLNGRAMQFMVMGREPGVELVTDPGLVMAPEPVVMMVPEPGSLTLAALGAAAALALRRRKG
jgi:autotransporter-associated beta strand protein